MHAAELERSVWARELHDQTLQDLAAVRMLLAGALRSPDRADVDRALEQAMEQVRFSAGALRGLITDLRPASLDELGPGPALRALVARSAATSGLEIALDADLAHDAGRSPIRHTPELESALYRLVQEALTNVGKHAGATRVSVEISEDEESVHVQVRDDGTGFDPARRTEGFGLLGMRERVALLTGTLEIDSHPGLGTTVTARLPVSHR
jgi:signal transduction histidine kinase